MLLHASLRACLQCNVVSSLLILVPTFDSYELLPGLVCSLQQQVWANWRILFVDGSSCPTHRQWLDLCCTAERRCSWMLQDPAKPGIFGAMDLGFIHSAPGEWLLFWGSDDLAAGPEVLAKAFSAIDASRCTPDLLVCRGRYFDSTRGVFKRSASFCSSGFLSAKAFRRALLCGSTPPHQATMFGPGARRRLAQYASGFFLSADLDYFLQLSRHPGLRVQCLDLELVHMADGGVSGQQTQRRLHEVRRAYRRAFGWCWWFPFLTRYLRRAVSVLDWTR